MCPTLVLPAKRRHSAALLQQLASCVAQPFHRPRIGWGLARMQDDQHGQCAAAACIFGCAPQLRVEQALDQSIFNLAPTLLDMTSFFVTLLASLRHPGCAWAAPPCALSWCVCNDASAKWYIRELVGLYSRISCLPPNTPHVKSQPLSHLIPHTYPL
jgi:hypothetical protein